MKNNFPVMFDVCERRFKTNGNRQHSMHFYKKSFNYYKSIKKNNNKMHTNKFIYLKLNKTIDCEGMVIIINAIYIKHLKRKIVFLWIVCVCVQAMHDACGAQE